MGVQEMLQNYAAEKGLSMQFDADGACTLPLDEERVLHLQFREAIGELDFVALLGSVPEHLRGFVFQRLLAANYYWKDTLGATLSWHDELEQVVLAYPIKIDTTDEATLRGTLDRFVDLQDAWAERLKSEIAAAEAAEELSREDEDDELSDLDDDPEDAQELDDAAESAGDVPLMRFDA